MSIDEQALLSDLDELASISSVEQFHEASLSTFRGVCHLITGQPSTRTGRYAAVRDAIKLAIERIDDTAFADAAEALLGNTDRWRSVRDRCTDAGRAFTPVVSYDAFRRKSGRNYRTNTLRMVADALVAEVTEITAAQSLPREHDPMETADSVGAANASTDAEMVADLMVQPLAVARQRHARRALGVKVFVTAFVGVLTAAFAWTQLAGDGAVKREELAVPGAAAAVATAEPSVLPESTPAPVLTVAPASAITPPADIASPEANTPAVKGVQTVAAAPTATGVPAPNVAQGGVDVSRQCRLELSQFGDLFGERNLSVDGGWVCRDAEGSVQIVPSFTDACHEQYGPSAKAVFGGQQGWSCQLKLHDVTSPREADVAADGCLVSVGGYDHARLAAFDRYSRRFVMAFLEADLPPGTCASEPMHFWGDPSVSGVSQELMLDGVSHGAIVGDGPLNVTVLTGDLWRAYDSIRDVLLYARGLSSLEDRAGYPVGAVQSQNGVRQLDLSGGGALVSGETGGGFVWMPKVWLDIWMGFGGRDGCLGLPLQPPPSSASSRPEMVFENATVYIDADTGGFGVEPASTCN